METPVPHVAPVRPGTWLFWLSWVAASTAALLLSFGMLYGSIFLGNAVIPGFNEDRFGGLIFFPILGILMGVLQWLLLRRRVPRAGWWIPATLAGLVGGTALAVAVVRALMAAAGEMNWDSRILLLLLYGIIGFILALAQLPILWRRLPGFFLWPLVSTLGWSVLSLITGKSFDRATDVLALGAVPALFTGLFLAWSLRAHRGPPERPA
jgi:hypothetical protein